MQRVLISDPFLFAPSGGKSTRNHHRYGHQQHLQRQSSQDGEEVDRFITYTKQEFEKAWEDSASEGSSSPASYLFDYSEQESEETSPLLSPYLPLTPESLESFEMDEYSDDLTQFGTSDEVMRFDNSDLVVPNNPSKDTSMNYGMLGEENIDLNNIPQADDFRDFNLGDFMDEKQLVHFLATAGSEDQSTSNVYQSLQPVDPSASLYETLSPPPATGLMNANDPTLPSMILPPQPVAQLPAPATTSPTDAKPRGRKSAHVVKPCSPPSYADSLPASPMVKQEPLIADPALKTPIKRRKTASASSSVSSMSTLLDADESIDSPRCKKPKMHERPYDPKAKNAVAAKKNREKKKNEEQRLKLENDALRLQLSSKEALIQETAISKLELEKQLEVERARNLSLQGLARVTQSAGCILKMVTAGIYNGSGEQYAVEFPNWFQQAPGTAQLELCEAAQEFLQVGKTSSYITLHVSEQEKKIIVDYSPNDPQISHDIPVPH